MGRRRREPTLYVDRQRIEARDAATHALTAAQLQLLADFLTKGELLQLVFLWYERHRIPKRHLDKVERILRRPGTRDLKLGRDHLDNEIYKALVRWLYRSALEAVRGVKPPYRSKVDPVTDRLLEISSGLPAETGTLLGVDLRFDRDWRPPRAWLRTLVESALSTSRRGVASYALGIVMEILNSDPMENLTYLVQVDADSSPEEPAFRVAADLVPTATPQPLKRPITEEYLRRIVKSN